MACFWRAFGHKLDTSLPGSSFLEAKSGADKILVGNMKRSISTLTCYPWSSLVMKVGVVLSVLILWLKAKTAARFQSRGIESIGVLRVGNFFILFQPMFWPVNFKKDSRCWLSTSKLEQPTIGQIVSCQSQSLRIWNLLFWLRQRQAFENFTVLIGIIRYGQTKPSSQFTSSPLQTSTTRISTQICYLSEYHFAKRNYESERFRSFFWKEVYSQN